MAAALEPAHSACSSQLSAESLSRPTRLRIVCPAWSSPDESEAECSSPSTPRQLITSASSASPPPAPRKPTARVADNIPCFFEHVQLSPASSQASEEQPESPSRLEAASSGSSACSTPTSQATTVVCPNAPARNNSIKSGVPINRASLFSAAGSTPGSAAPSIVFTPAGTPCCLTQRSPSVQRSLLQNFNAVAVPATPQNTDQLPGCPASMSLWMRRMLAGSPTTAPSSPEAAFCSEAAPTPTTITPSCFSTPVKASQSGFAVPPAPSPCLLTPQLFARPAPRRTSSQLDLAAAADWIAQGRTPGKRATSLPAFGLAQPDLSSPPAKRSRYAYEPCIQQRSHSVVQQEMLRLSMGAHSAQRAAACKVNLPTARQL